MPKPTLHDFSDTAVRLDLLRQRAFNHRWAEQDADVIPLTAADHDFPIAPFIRERLALRATEGVMVYGPPWGLTEYRQTVSNWMRTTRRIECGPEHVFATDGAASAMALVARATLGPGDEALIPEPVDFLFRHAVEQAGARAVPVPLAPTGPAEDFIEGLKAVVTPRTRMLWLCTPHNPLGVVHSFDWIEKVTCWAVSRGLRILSDEVWSDIVFHPHRHTSPASLSPEIAKHIAVVYGFSKNFGLAGLRVGCVVCTDSTWMQRIVEASGADCTLFGVSTLSQEAAIAALQYGDAWLKDFVAHLKQQRDFAINRLSRWPGVQTHEPQGTFVLFPHVGSLTHDVKHWCEDMKRDARVALVPGVPDWFGGGAEGHVRISFATSQGILNTAFDRIDQWLEANGVRILG